MLTLLNLFLVYSIFLSNTFSIATSMLYYKSVILFNIK